MRLPWQEVDEQTGKPMVVLSGVYLMRGDGPDPMTIRTKLQVRAQTHRRPDRLEEGSAIACPRLYA